MKLFIFLIAVILFSSSIYAFKSTENTGMNKYERINKLEKNVIQLSNQVSQLKARIQRLESKKK